MALLFGRRQFRHGISLSWPQSSQPDELECLPGWFGGADLSTCANKTETHSAPLNLLQYRARYLNRD